MNESTRARPRFLVTRDGDGAAAWCRRLEERGCEAVWLPLVHHETVDDPALVADLRRALKGARWLAFSSTRGVDAVAELVGPGAVPGDVRLAAVGPKTAARCREVFGRCEVVPAEATGAALARRLLAEIEADGSESTSPLLVVAAANRGRRDFEEILAPRGVAIRRFAVYSTRSAGPRGAGSIEPRRDLADENLAAVLLASPSAVTGLERVVARPEALRLVTLRATTSAAVRALGLPVFAQAAEPSLDAMIDAWAAAVEAGERAR